MSNMATKKSTLLRYLSSSKWEREAPPDGPELSGYLGWRREEATPVLNALRKQGHVERLGKSMNNAWCWKITDAGRAELSKEQGVAPSSLLAARTEKMARYIIDWRIEGSFEVDAASPENAQEKFDRAWNNPRGILPDRDGEVSNGPPQLVGTSPVRKNPNT